MLNIYLTEQFVGMNGSAADNVGMAIASYDWMAAITLVFGALFFLPLYGALHLPLFTHVAFLNKMAITFGTIRRVGHPSPIGGRIVTALNSVACPLWGKVGTPKRE